MGYKKAALYLKSIKPDLKRCVEACQYSDEYLKGYEGAISCLEFAAKEYETQTPLRHAPESKGAKLNYKKPEREIAVCSAEELAADLVKIIRMLGLLEGVGL